MGLFSVVVDKLVGAYKDVLDAEKKKPVAAQANERKAGVFLQFCVVLSMARSVARARERSLR